MTHPTPIPHDEIATIREALEEADERFYNIGLYPEDSSRVMVKDALTVLASIESALATSASAYRAGQEQMRERVAVEFDKKRAEALAQIEHNIEYTRRIGRGDDLWSDSNKLCREHAGRAERASARIRALPLTVEAPGAKPLDYARRVLDDPVASSGAEAGE